MPYRLMLTILLLSSWTFAQEYRIEKSAQNLVTFTSEAPVEKIVGTTPQIDGYVIVRTVVGDSSAEFYFEVDLASLDTGIGLRNRHMRDNYLETDKYPYAAYRGTIIQFERAENGDYKVKTKGTFSLHGIEKEMEIEGTVTPSDSGYRAVSRFPVALKDFKIERPQFMMLKIGEVLKLDVAFTVQTVKK